MHAVLAAGDGKPLNDSVDGLFSVVINWCAPNRPTDDVSILGLHNGCCRTMTARFPTSEVPSHHGGVKLCEIARSRNSHK